MSRYLTSCLCFFLVSCGSTSTGLNKLEHRQMESIQRHTTGTVELLDGENDPSPRVLLAKRLSRNAQHVAGLPADRMDVGGALAGDLAEVLAQEETDEEIVRKVRIYQQELMDQGRVKEFEDRKSLVRRIWGWLLSTLGFGGIIALLVFCPALIPVFGKILATVIGWVVRFVPAAVNFFGVVSASAFTNISAAVGDVREQLKKEPDKTYTAEEVQKMIDDAMNHRQDEVDRTVWVEAARRKNEKPA